MFPTHITPAHPPPGGQGSTAHSLKHLCCHFALSQFAPSQFVVARRCVYASASASLPFIRVSTGMLAAKGASNGFCVLPQQANAKALHRYNPAPHFIWINIAFSFALFIFLAYSSVKPSGFRDSFFIIFVRIFETLLLCAHWQSQLSLPRRIPLS